MLLIDPQVPPASIKELTENLRPSHLSECVRKRRERMGQSAPCSTPPPTGEWLLHSTGGPGALGEALGMGECSESRDQSNYSSTPGLTM